MIHEARRRNAYVGQVLQSGAQHFDAVLTEAGHQTVQARRLTFGELIRNAGVREFGERLTARHADHRMDFVELIELVVAGKQWVQREQLEEHTADRPDVDLGPVKAGRDQRLGRPIPTRRYVRRVGRLFRCAGRRSQVGQLDNLGLGVGTIDNRNKKQQCTTRNIKLQFRI